MKIEGSDLVKELGPVRTVTRKEIVPGKYGPGDELSIEIGSDYKEIFIDLESDWYRANEIREVARLLTEIADAMEENNGR